MIHIDFTLETARMIADRKADGTWSGFVCDSDTGQEVTFANWTDDQMAAVNVLAIAGDAPAAGPFDAAALYAIAEDLMKDWPTGCRMIP